MTGLVVWFTGLPAAGKTTLAAAVRERLRADGLAACVLDSDEFREALRPKLGFGEDDRIAFYDTLGNVAGLLSRQGLIVLVAATANLRRFRDDARHQAPAFLEVYVDTTAEECAKRDFKGLYQKLRAGSISGLPGMDAAYEVPQEPDEVAHGGLDREATERIVALVEARVLARG